MDSRRKIYNEREWIEMQRYGNEPRYPKNYTHLPPTIQKIHRQHAEVYVDLCLWIEDDLGLKVDAGPIGIYKDKGRKAMIERARQNTCLNIKMRHDNDYVECGPGYYDPTGEMFRIMTEDSILIEFNPEDLQYVVQQFHLFARHKHPDSPKFPQVSFEFYDWRNDRMFKINDTILLCTKPKMSFRFEFTVSHSWGSKFND